jgi:hypothetical protein
MLHVVFCWELGDGLGHIVPLAALSRQMVIMGYRVTCILKDTTHAPRLLEPYGVTWFEAPRFPRLSNPIFAINHADILHNTGYSTSEQVSSLLVAWRAILTTVKADLVFCESAPTARLAALSLSIEVRSIDSGFAMPPMPNEKTGFMPAIRPEVLTEQLAASETRTLSVINEGLVRLRLNPLSSFSHLFQGDVWYRNWCDFNHFSMHSPERHLGQIEAVGGGVLPIWPKNGARKLFAYLKYSHPASLLILQAAIRLGYKVVAYLPDFPASVVSELVAAGCTISTSVMYRLDQLSSEIDISLWHSATGAAAHCLGKGIRMIFFPMHPEQYLACSALRRLGLNIHIVTRTEKWTEFLEAVQAWPKQAFPGRWKLTNAPDFAARILLN